MTRLIPSSIAAAILVALLLPIGGNATIGSLPSSAYVNGTKLVTFSAKDETMLSSISDGFLTIGFPTPMRASTVGDNWSSWGAPPNTESASLRVLWSDVDANFNPINSVTFSLSRPVSVFGFEAEPGPTSSHKITANFLMGGRTVQTIALDVNGNAGAMLFAASATQGTFFDSVTVTSDADWAVGEIRYAVIPDLTISKTHPGGAGGHFSQGQNGGVYTISASNIGQAPSNGMVMVTETLPSGMSLVSMTGSGWLCGTPNPSNVCTRTDAVGVNSAFLPITVTVNVSPTAPASLTNTATVSGGSETIFTNDTATDPTTINPIVNVTGSVSVTQGGFGRNRSTGLWAATMTVTNTSKAPITGPIQVVLTNLIPGVTMANNTGLRNGVPYITVSSGALSAGASVSLQIQFQNPSNGFISFTPVAESGIY